MIDNDENVFSSIRDKTNELTFLQDIGKAITSTLDIKEIMSIIMAKMNDLLYSENWSLLLIDEKKSELFFEIVVGGDVDTIKNIRLKLGEGIAGWVAKTGEALLIPDVNKDKRFSKKVDQVSDFTTESVICVPLKSKGKILGVIELINKDNKRLYSEDDLITLLIIADYAAIAIENAKYLQKVQELIITDDLTKLYNSRYLNEFLDVEISRIERYGGDVSVIFIDLDFFKQVNDTYGHLIGSQVLVEIADIIRDKMRKIDFAARYGGDEFVIVLPYTNKENAYLVASRIRESINSAKLLKDEGLSLKISASFGISSLPEDAADKIELIRLADQAMYKVKNTSRDAIILA